MKDTHSLLRTGIGKYAVLFSEYLESFSNNTTLNERQRLKDALNVFEDELIEYVDATYVRRPNKETS